MLHLTPGIPKGWVGDGNRRTGSTVIGNRYLIEDADARPPHIKRGSCVGVAQCVCFFLLGFWLDFAVIAEAQAGP